MSKEEEIPCTNLSKLEISPKKFLKSLENKDIKMCDLLFAKLCKNLDINSLPFLYMACKKGILSYVKIFLERYGKVINVNKPVGKKVAKKSILGIAIKRQRFECVKELLRFPKINVNNGWSVEGTDEVKTPLYYACANGMVDYVRLLLNHNSCDVNKGYYRTSDENKRVGIGEYKEMETPLCCACRRGSVEIVRMLLKKGADVNAGFVTRKGHIKTCLYMATERNSIDVVKLLLKSPKIDVNASNKKSPLMIACEMNHLGIVKELCKCKSVDFGRSHNLRNCLHSACEKGCVSVVEELLKVKKLPLNVGHEGIGTPLIHSVTCEKVEIVRLLAADKRVDMNAQTLFGDTALHIAAEKGSELICAILLTSGRMDVTKKNKNGKRAYDLGNPIIQKAIRFYRTEKESFIDKYTKLIERECMSEQEKLDLLSQKTVIRKNYGDLGEMAKTKRKEVDEMVQFQSDLSNLTIIRREMRMEKEKYFELKRIQDKYIAELKEKKSTLLKKIEKKE